MLSTHPAASGVPGGGCGGVLSLCASLLLCLSLYLCLSVSLSLVALAKEALAGEEALALALADEALAYLCLSVAL